MTTFTSLTKRFCIALPIISMLSLGTTVHAAAPIANTDSYTSNSERIDADKTKIFPALVLLANDDGSDLVFEGINGSSSTDGASISLSSGNITYDPRGVSVFVALPEGGLEDDTFTYTISGSDGPNDTGTVVIRVVGINDAPSFGALPSSPIALGDKTPTQPFASTTVNDPDSGELVAITLDVNDVDHNDEKGTFAQSFGYSGSKRFSAPNGNGVYELTGATVAQAQQALRDLTFTPAENYSPPGTIDDTVFTLTLTDGALSDSGNSFTINVTSINDVPVITNGGNSTYTLSAGDQADIFTEVTLVDEDIDAVGTTEGDNAGIFVATITLSRAGSGSVYGTLTGPNFKTTTATEYTLEGTREELLAAIQSIGYIAPSADDDFTIALKVTDPAPSQADTVAGSVEIVVSVSQPSPGIIGLVATQSMTDKNVTQPLFGSALFNNFGNISRRVVVTVGNNNGIEGSFDVLAGFSNDGNGVYSFVGSSVEATNAIRGLRFTPTPDIITGANDVVTFSIEVEDTDSGAVLDAVDPAVTLTITPVNDAPSISSPDAEIFIDDDAVGTKPFANVILNDPDEGGNQEIYVTVTLVGEDLDSGAPRNGGGELDTSTTPTLGFVKEASAVFTYTFSGTPAEVTTLLQGLVFTADPDRNPEGQRERINFTIFVEDTADSTGLSAQNQGTTVIVLSVNGAPIIGEIPPLAQQPFPVPGSKDAGGIYTTSPFEKLTLTDDDGGDLTLSIKLDNAAKGTLIDSGSDFTSADGGLTYVMTGTEADIQSALQGLVYSLDKGYSFPLDELGATTFTLTATDSSAGNITTEVLSIIIRERNVAYIVSNTDDVGPGSLRDAVGSAANNDFIVFELQPDAYPATIFLQSALTVSKNITVVGSGVADLTISGDSNDDGVGDVPLFVVTDGADLTLEHLTLKLGKAPSYGGAVSAVAGSRIVARFCSFEENTASQFGGAIDLFNGELLVESCLFLNNTVNESTAIAGGAISVATNLSSVIRNSTFVGNAQLNPGAAGGGAIYAENSVISEPFKLLVEHCTFKSNTDAANNGSSIHGATDGLLVTVRNNIFGDSQGRVLDVSGAAKFTSEGGNIATDFTKTTYTDDPRDIYLLNDSIDLVDTDPLLLGLADNGGETLTCALDAGSKALGYAVIASVVAEQPAVDQRGAWRDATPDAGAFEAGTFKRILINELFVTVDTEDQFIEFYNPRDSEELTLNGLEVFVDGVSAGTLSGLPALLPGAGAAWPPAAGLTLDREKGTIELRNVDGQAVLSLNYIASFVDVLGDVNTLGQSITRYPRYEGGLLPHERVYELVTGGTTGLRSSSKDLDVDGSPLDGGNAPPIAVVDLDENGDALYSILATDTIAIDVLANDVEFDRSDTLKITELMELKGDLASVVASEFTQIVAESLELAAVAASGDIFFPITPVLDDTVFTFDPVNVSVTIDADGFGLMYDPTTSPTVIALSKDETITDYWAYTMRDYDATDTPQSRGSNATFQEDNIKKATSYFTVLITGINEDPIANADDNVELATTENRALRMLADADLLTAVPEFDFIDQDADFQEFDSMGVQGTFKPFYPEVALLANDDDVDNDDTNKTIRIISVNQTAGEKVDLLTTTSELGASVTLDLRTERIETNILYDPRASTGILNKLSEGEQVTDSFYYKVLDAHGATDEAKVSIVVTGVNDVPTARDDTGFITNEDGSLDFIATVLTGNDSDPDQNDTGKEDTPVIAQPVIPATSVNGATLTYNGVPTTSITYDPRTIPTYESLARNETLEDSFTYTLDDGEGGTDTATVSITVEGRNDAPTAEDDFRAVTENDTATVGTPGLLINDEDVDINSSTPDDDPWIIPQRGVVTPLGASLNINPDGSYRYDANSVAIDALIEGQQVTETFEYTITDNSRTSASDDTLRVLRGLADIDLPILLNDRVVGATPTTIAAYTEDLSDPSVIVIESANHALRNGLFVKIEGYEGSGNYNGVYPITSVDRDHFSVTVPFADDPSGTRGTWVPWFVISEVTTPDNGGNVQIVDGQTVLYTASAGFSGEETFRYTILDGAGGQDVGTVFLEVVDPTQNKLLVASPDRFRVGMGTKNVQVDVLLNDVTLPGNIANLTILEATETVAGKGIVELVNGKTALSYTPPSDTFVGPAIFDYTISAGGVATSTAQVTFVVEDRMINNTGDALLGQLSGNEDQFVVVSESKGNLLDVLANDPNLPSYPVSSTILSVTAASGVVLVEESDSLTLSYDAPVGIGSGVDSFEYTAVDASGATTTHTVTIEIVEDVASFNAQPDFYTVVAGSDMVLLPVLTNDKTVQNDSAVIRIEKLGLGDDAPPNASRIAISGGSNFIEYTPPSIPPALGQEDFNYEISIGGIELKEAKVTIKIVDSLPIQTQAEDDFFTVARDSGPHILDLVNNDLPYPLAGWSWKIASVSAASNSGVVSKDGDSTVSYQPAAGFFGTETFTYEITDAFGATDTATVTVKVGELITAPDAFVVLEDSTANPLNVLANDDLLNRYGVDYTIKAFTNPANGTVTIDGSGPNNQLLYTPEEAYVGEDTFDYTVEDKTGDQLAGTVTISVIAANSDRDIADLLVEITGVNDIPQLSGTADSAMTDKETIQPFDTDPATVLITDLDEFGAQLQSVTVTFDSTYGSISAPAMTMNDPGSYSIVDTPANVTAALRAIVFTPTENVIDYIDPGFFDLDFNLSIDDYDVGITQGVSDGPDAPIQDVTTIRITPINDDPTLVSAISDLFMQVNDLPRAILLTPHFDDVDDDVPGGELTWTVTGNTNPSIFDGVTVNAEKQLLVVDLATDQFGIADVTVRGTDRGGLFVEDSFRITVDGPPVIALKDGQTKVAGPQYVSGTRDDLYREYRQSFRVKNDGVLTAEAFIVHISNIDQPVESILVERGEYSTDENGTPDIYGDDVRSSDAVTLLVQGPYEYSIKYDLPLEPGESVVVHITYSAQSFDTVTITPTIRIELTTATSVVSGSAFITIPDEESGNVKLTFAVESGVSYAVQSSYDLITWDTWGVTLPVSDFDRELTIYDDGLYTDSPPSFSPQRFYRLVELPLP